MKNHPDVNNLTWLELRLLDALRRTAPEKRELVVKLTEVWPESWPARPALRLVKTTVGGHK